MYATVFNSPNIVQFLVENQAELDTQNDVCVPLLVIGSYWFSN